MSSFIITPASAAQLPAYIVFLLLFHDFFLRKTKTMTNTTMAPVPPIATSSNGSSPPGVVPVGVVVVEVVRVGL
ncbi:MAG: hypothetical protein ACW98U_15995 [Candidatus Thorarchaeota archaeon]|jgi:hypothetical protein